MKIEEIDKNFKTKSSLDIPDIRYYSPLEEPFALYGLYRPQELGEYRRLPQEIAASVSPGVSELGVHTSGGRVRFQTDSPYVTIKAELSSAMPVSHMALSGTCGFDLYVYNGAEDVYHGSFLPPYSNPDSYESVVYFPDRTMREITIHFPLYSGVKKLLIGVAEGSKLAPGREYRSIQPVLYYGSSITQGACASRPGNNYPAVIARELNVDFLCLGFSGSAKAEKEMVDYLAELDASVFVCDYDHNAPNSAHLKKTYPYLYEHYREKNPYTPVIFISRPDVFFDREDYVERRDVIYRTYIAALEGGDRNVYFIDGFSIFAGLRQYDCTVDCTHPNDLGFFRMAQVIGDKVRLCLSHKLPG